MRAFAGIIRARSMGTWQTQQPGERFSRSYERVMNDRHVSDYDAEAIIAPERATADVKEAERFVDRVEAWLKQGGWL